MLALANLNATRQGYGLFLLLVRKRASLTLFYFTIQATVDTSFLAKGWLEAVTFILDMSS
jgi:hypothetical protein